VTNLAEVSAGSHKLPASTPVVIFKATQNGYGDLNWVMDVGPGAPAIEGDDHNVVSADGATTVPAHWTLVGTNGYFTNIYLEHNPPAADKIHLAHINSAAADAGTLLDDPISYVYPDPISGPQLWQSDGYNLQRDINKHAQGWAFDSNIGEFWTVPDPSAEPDGEVLQTLGGLSTWATKTHGHAVGSGGTIAGSDAGVTLTGSTLNGAALNGAAFGAASLGSLAFTTTISVPGAGGSGGTITLTGNGVGGTPNGVIFTGTFGGCVLSEPAANPAGSKYLLLTGVFTGTGMAGETIQGILHVWSLATGAGWTGTETIDSWSITWSTP
jgi:hypothetical protein